jgi:thiol:disulfide interchange protein/DsbC/DsbD-like thiol-disulfide interchange protein
MKRLLLALALLFAALPAVAQEVDRAPKVTARLLAEGPVAPGGEVWVALEEVIRPGWHTYWINPGDAGNPTTIDWTLPAGWSAGEIQWPQPKRLPVGPLMDYGYEGKLWLLTALRAPADAKPGDTVKLDATVAWLVCERICIPEEAALSVSVRIGEGPRDPALAADFAAARALLPTPSPWKVSYALSNSIDLFVAAPALATARPASVEFYPLDAGAIKNPAPQLVGYNAQGLVLRLTPGSKAATLTALNGVLVLTGSDGSVQALDIKAPQGLVPAADFSSAPDSAAAADAMPLWLAMAFAALGGLILNIMPCVLPILAMKALALARHSGSERSIVIGETFAYSGGVILSFLILGAALVALRAGGEAVGWGFQLQSPIAVAAFALLVFAVGLNLSGVFEVGSITAGESLTHKSGAAGAFFTGVLAVAVGAPCTMPFGAAALGFALTQNAMTAMLVFLALGVGFALPFLVLGLVPGALAFVPKPGTWMLRFKQFLAFPMYAAAAWLAWVLAVQAGANSLVILFGAAVTLALAAWLWAVTRDLSTRGRSIGALVVLLLLVGVGAAVAQLKTAQASQAADSGGAGASLPNREPYSAARLEELRAAGRPVLVDTTAAWCISCLVNEQTALASEAVKTAFTARNIAYLVADWTNRNPEGAALLQSHGRAGPPLYLYYPPGAAAPKVLPQILTEAIVLEAISAP